MTEHIYIAAGTGTAKYLESIDGKYPSADIFQKTKLTDSFRREKALDVYLIDTKAEDFEKFKGDLLKAYAAYRKKSAENPTEAAMMNVLHHLENPGIFQVSLPAGPRMTEWLTSVFKTTAEVKGKYPGTDLNRVILRFDRSSLTPAQRAELDTFFMQMLPGTFQDIVSKYGTGYLNLLLFASEVTEKEIPPTPPETSGPQPLAPDEPRHMYCTAKSGAVSVDEATLIEPGSITTGRVHVGEQIVNVSTIDSLALVTTEKDNKASITKNEPILEHFGESQPGKKDVIYMPLRKIHFPKNEIEPTGDFEGTVKTMVDDLYEITSGDFAKTCGVHRLRDFDGELTVYFVGMADPIGDPEKNQKLSEDRARVIAEEFAKQLRARNDKEPLKTRHGVRVMYAGVGEQGKKEIDPEFRQTRSLIMSRGKPDYKTARWHEVLKGRIKGSPMDFKGTMLEAECIGMPDGCERLLNQCLDDVAYICEDSHSEQDDIEICTERLQLEAWRLGDLWLRDDEPGIHERLASGYYDLRLHHYSVSGEGEDRVVRSSGNHSLHQCFRAGQKLLRTHGPHTPRSWTSFAPLDVVNESVAEGTLSPNVKSVCTDSRGTVDSSELTVVRTTNGHVLKRNGEYLTTLGSEPVAIDILYKSLLVFDWTFPNVWPAARHFRYDPFIGEIIHFEETLNLVRQDIRDILERKGIYDECIGRILHPVGGVRILMVYPKHWHRTFEMENLDEKLKEEFGDKTKLEISYVDDPERLDDYITDTLPRYSFSVIVEPIWWSLFNLGYRDTTTEFETNRGRTGVQLDEGDEAERAPVSVETPEEK